MKRYIRLFVLFLVMLLVGCNDTEDVSNIEETIENVETKDTQPMEEELEDSTIVDKIEEVIEYTEERVYEPLTISVQKVTDNDEMDGCKIHNIECEYLVINNPTDNIGINILNKTFFEDAFAMLEECRTYAQESQDMLEEEIATDEYDEEHIIEYTNSIDVKYNDNGILSVVNYFHEKGYMSGEESDIRFSTTYDINTGEILYISDILKMSEKELEEIIGNAFLESDFIDKDIKAQYEQELLGNTSYTNFYLDEQGIVLYYESKSILPIDKGELIARIDYESGFFEGFYSEEN